MSFFGRAIVCDERGSILLIALVSIAVTTLLGLAVYDLALIEARFSAMSVTDYRAYEVAQAGVERGIRELRNLYVGKAPGQETFVAGSTSCAPTPCDATQFHPMSISNVTTPATPLIVTGQFASGSDPGGTYSLELKYLTLAEANNSVSVTQPDGLALVYPSGLQCIPDNVFPNWCANLVFLRSSGTTTDSTGTTRTRTIQTLVRASSTSPWAGGIVAGPGVPSGSPVVSGDVLIAGTVHVLGDLNSNPAVNITGGSNAGMVNNWFPLDPGSGYSQAEQFAVPPASPSDNEHPFNRLTPKQLICPPGPPIVNCAGGANLVESLAAEIKIFGNLRFSMFNTGNGTNLGQAGATPTYGSPRPSDAASLALGRIGKGELDGVYIAGGCVLPCTGGAPNSFGLGGGSLVTVDGRNLTKPYPNRPPIGPLLDPSGVWPVRNDAVTISNNVTGTDYPQFYSGWFTPNVSGGANTASWTTATVVNPANCGGTPDQIDECGRSGGVPFTLGALLGSLRGGTITPASGLFPPADGSDGTPPFRHAFTFTDRLGIQRSAEICWRRDLIGNLATSNPANKGANPPGLLNTLEVGIPTCAAPSGPQNAAVNVPVMFAYSGPFAVASLNPASGNHQYINFRGWALVAADSPVSIDENFQSYCDNPWPTNPPCYGATASTRNRFPENHLFAVMSTKDVSISTDPARDNKRIHVFGYYWTEANIKVGRDVNVIGMLRGSTVCFRNSTGCGGVAGGGGIPGFFQASFFDQRKIPNELAAPYEVPGQVSGGRWQVTSVPQFWIECRRPLENPPPTAPSPLPKGPCSYDQ